jgi:hypothetical protein
VILKVTPRGRLRIAVKRMRVRDMVKDVTLKAGESNNTWIVNQVRLKAQL